MSEDNGQSGCAVCRLVRTYLFIAIPLIIAISLGAGSDFLAQIDLISLASVFVTVGLVVTVAWRAYQEYWRK